MGLPEKQCKCFSKRCELHNRYHTNTSFYSARETLYLFKFQTGWFSNFCMALFLMPLILLQGRIWKEVSELHSVHKNVHSDMEISKKYRLNWGKRSVCFLAPVQALILSMKTRMDIGKFPMQNLRDTKFRNKHRNVWKNTLGDEVSQDAFCPIFWILVIL
jgi:hypothetical protein